jgi:hypothetical protein
MQRLARLLATGMGLLGLTGPAHASDRPAIPVFAETFAYDPATGGDFLRRWSLTRSLDNAIGALRASIVADSNGKTVARIIVRSQEALEEADEATIQARHYVCDSQGSRANAIEAEPGGTVPTERTEIQMKRNDAAADGDVVRFDAPVWYRFSFKVGDDWPQDRIAPGRTPCRTVIHQIKQDSYKDGDSCGASPFFKIEARPFGTHIRFFAQASAGSACTPGTVRRTQFCVADDLEADTWISVNVRLYPALDARGEADVWLNGRYCGSYRGPMGDALFGARRDGVPYVNVQPRFGIYRDWRAETQTIYFDKILFWHTEPKGHPDWAAESPSFQ